MPVSTLSLIHIFGLLGDTVAANRKLLEDVQYHVRKMDYDDHPEVKTPDDKPLSE